MAFDVLSLGMLLAGVVVVCTASAHARRSSTLLPFDDQPPPAAFLAIPRGRRLSVYMGEGLVEIDAFLDAPEPD